VARALLPAHPAPADIVWLNTPSNRAIITSAPPVRTGGASGMQQPRDCSGRPWALVALVFGCFQ
jgi:DHA2 family multidrug resistance protein-like MFS transporter